MLFDDNLKRYQVFLFVNSAPESDTKAVFKNNLPP